MTDRRFLLLLFFAACMGTAAWAQVQSDVEVIHLRGPVYMIAAGGVNLTASIGPDGVLLADTGPAALSDKIQAAIREVQKEQDIARALMEQAPLGGAEVRSATQTLLYGKSQAKSSGPVRFILNTNVYPDHNGGNPKMAIAIPEQLSAQDPSEIATHVYAHENVLQRASGATGDHPVPFEFWPSDVYSASIYKLTSYFNGEGIELLHVPAASTDGDSFVWFRTSDVISAGDIYRTDAYPTPDLAMGGNIQGVIEGLNQLLDLAIPEYRQEGGTLIVPGHGRVSDSGDVAAYRDMVTIIRDRVQHLIEQGKTMEQIKAAKPSSDYDPRYGKAPGSVDKFIEAIYRSLNTKS